MKLATCNDYCVGQAQFQSVELNTNDEIWLADPRNFKFGGGQT